MRRHTQRKGDIAVSQAVATFTKKGYDVALLLTESASYDLIVDIEGELSRVQVKYCGSKRGRIDLRSIWSNSKGYQVKNPSENSFDLLYVYKPDGKEYLIKSDHFRGKNQIVPFEDELIN